MNELTNGHNELKIHEDEAPASSNKKTLYISPNDEKFNYRGILGQVVQYFNMADIIDKIQVGSKYVVQIPTEHQKAFGTGEYFMMQNQKTGTMWPSLMKIADTGRNQVVTPLPIAEENFIQGNPVQDLAVGYHNLLMQQQMSQLIFKMEETYRIVEKIEHGQMDDRKGILEAGRNEMLLALSMSEGIERTMQIATSRDKLLTAHGQIGETLKRRVREFQPVSKHASVRFIKEFVKTGYLEGKDQEIREIQEYYDLYLQATKMIAASYAMCGDVEQAEKMFELSENTIKCLDFSNIKSIEHLHGEMGDMFYKTPIEYFSTEKEFCVEESKSYDYVSIEVTGEKLLEAINNDRKEEV